MVVDKCSETLFHELYSGLNVHHGCGQVLRNAVTFLISKIISHSARSWQVRLARPSARRWFSRNTTTRNTTIESPFKQLQPAAASKAQSKTYDHKTCFQQKSWPLDADRTPNVRDGTSHRDNPTKTPTTSLSKRENMHGLA